MKVLLMQDVEKLGQAGEVKMVAGGFGRNYLLPKGYAVLATPGQIKQAEERLGARRRRENLARRDAEALAARIGGVTLRFSVRAGEMGQLYGSVTTMDIASRLREEHDLEIDRRKIELGDPIKRIGMYPVPVRLAADLTPMLNVVVEGEHDGSTIPAETAAVPAGAADDDDMALPDLDSED